MTRKMLALLIVSLIVGVLTTGCVVHEKEKEVKEVKTTDSANP
jgi:hypothetical protein